MLTRPLIVVTVIVVLLWFYSIIFAADWYVDANSPNNPGTGTSGDPFRKIRYAVDNEKMQPGDKVFVKGGTYYEDGDLDITCSGTAGNYITFQPYDSNIPIIQPSKTYTGWATDSNGIYYRTFGDLELEPNLVRVGGYGITPVKTYNELLDPNIDEDLFHFNQSNDTLYVKLESGDPNTDVYMIPYGGNVTVTGSYINLTGFTIQYAQFCILWHGNHGRVIGNILKHSSMSSLIADGSSGQPLNDLLIQNNIISFTGTPLKYDPCSPTQLIDNNHDHSIYLSKVDDANVTGNFADNCIGGQSMHPWSQYDTYNLPSNCVIHNNWFEGKYGGFVGSGTGNEVYNNIVIATGSGRYGLYVWHSSGYEIYNNVIDGDNGILLGCQSQGPAETITFKNNIVLANPGNYCVEINGITNPQIDNNIYYSGQSARFRVGEEEFTDFTSYQTYMKQNYNDCEADSGYDNPEFLSGSDYHLRPNSPCIDAGDNTVGLTKDYDGNQRPLPGGFIKTATIDIGPYEYAGYPGQAFHVKESSGRSVAYFDYLGNLVLAGSLTQNGTPTATAADEFRVQDFYGVDVAIIDNTTGNMVIKGTKKTIPPDWPWIPPCSFVVKGSDGKVVAYIDIAGDLYLKGNLYE